MYDHTLALQLLPPKNEFVFRYEMKATGRADLAANEKVLDLYTSNLQLEDQLHGVRKEVEDAKSLAEKVPRDSSSSHRCSAHSLTS
jgi:hypothetical protein